MIYVYLNLYLKDRANFRDIKLRREYFGFDALLQIDNRWHNFGLYK